MRQVLSDLRYGFRGFLSRPGFAAVVVLTLALGIGANTAIFSMVRSVILKPLPYHEPDRLVRIYETHGKRPRFQWGEGRSYILVRPGTLHDWRDRSRSFESVEAVRWRTKTLTGSEQAEAVWANEVTEGFFRIAGVKAALGRTLDAGDFGGVVARAAVISDRLWRNRYGADPSIIGRHILIDGVSVPVAGVMPPEFYPDRYLSSDLWIPYAAVAGERSDRTTWSFVTLARLKGGVSLEQAIQEMDVISDRMAAAQPEHYGDLSAIVVPVTGEIIGPHETLLFTLLGAVGLVLLIGCVNVANLMLARGMGRSQEFAVRAALGAGRARLIRQLLTESLLLAGIGGALGLIIAKLSLRPILSLLPTERAIPRMQQVQLDWQVLIFTLGLSCLTGILFGLAPAWSASRVSLNESLKEGGRTSSGGRRTRRFGNALVVGEVALSLLLLVGAGLLLRSFWMLQQVQSGFRTEQVLAMQITVPAHRYGEYEVGGTNPKRAIFFRELDRQIAEVPGVASVAVTSLLPFRHAPNPWSISIEGRGAPAEKVQDGTARRNRAGLYAHGSISIERVTPGYFATLGVPLLRGRYLDVRDSAGAPLVTVVNETFVRKFFPGEDPVGRRITVDMTSYFPKMTIVGVVADNRMHGLDRELYPLLFWSMDQYPSNGAWVIVKANRDPAGIAGAVQDRVRRIDSDLAIKDVTTMPTVVAESLWRQRFTTLLIGVFAALALVLATAGIYAVISYSVSQRTQEMGLRVTLGAGAKEILSLIVGQGLRLCLAGIGIGLVASLAVQKLLASQLYGVSPNDPVTIAGVSLLLILVATLATYVPARRALRVDPVTALRTS